MNNTPKEYLSWSQYSLFKRSPKLYRDCYIYGKRMESIYMDFGKKVAESIESGELVGNSELDHINTFLPKDPKNSREYELSTNYYSGKGKELVKIPLYGKFDRFLLKKKILREVKTGTVAWTQNKVDSFEQITFYCFMIWNEYGFIPKNIELIWLPTKREGNEIVLTGEIRTFKTERKLIDIVKIGVEIKKVWIGINQLCAEEASKL